MLQKTKDYLSSRDWKFWAKVGAAVVVVGLMLYFGENVDWIVE